MVYMILKGVKISTSMERNVNNEFISGHSKKNQTFWTPVGHIKVTSSLLLERISKKCCYIFQTGDNKALSLLVNQKLVVTTKITI